MHSTVKSRWWHWSKLTVTSVKGSASSNLSIYLFPSRGLTNRDTQHPLPKVRTEVPPVKLGHQPLTPQHGDISLSVLLWRSKSSIWGFALCQYDWLVCPPWSDRKRKCPLHLPSEEAHTESKGHCWADPRILNLQIVCWPPFLSAWLGCVSPFKEAENGQNQK